MINKLLERYSNKYVFLIDFLWYCYKSYYVHEDFENNEGVKTGHLYGMSNLVQRILTICPDALIIMCEDYGAKERKELNEDYKANRKENIFIDIWNQAHDLYSDFPNIQFAYNEGYEADDMMFSISRIKDYNNHFIIISGDNDLMQALDETTMIARKVTYKGLQNIITPNSDYYKDKFQDLSPERIPMYRAIIGDKSDNLKPIKSKFPKKIAYYYAKNYPMLDPSEFNAKEAQYLSSIDESEIFQSNLKIMKLVPIEILLQIKNKGKTQWMIDELQLHAFKIWATRYLRERWGK